MNSVAAVLAAAAASKPVRRGDLDALRGFAMVLGIALHASLAYFPFPWPVQDAHKTRWLGLLYALINGFRMPLFFLLSGFFTMLVFERRGLRSLLRQRALRILLPRVIATATIVPLDHALFSWGMSLGLIGLFRRFFARPSGRVRWLSDASYWMYLVHLPLAVVCQELIRDLGWPAAVKFVVVLAAVVALTLVTYRFWVRYTPIGWLLNGPRLR